MKQAIFPAILLGHLLLILSMLIIKPDFQMKLKFPDIEKNFNETILTILTFHNRNDMYMIVHVGLCYGFILSSIPHCI